LQLSIKVLFADYEAPLGVWGNRSAIHHNGNIGREPVEMCV